MASKQLNTLMEILNQRKDEVKKLEESIIEWKTKEMDLERQYQEKQEVHFVLSLFFSFFFSFLFSKVNAFIYPVLIQRHNNLR